MTKQKRPIRRIACLGEVMVELVTEDGRNAALNVAGDTYNCAVYLARLLAGQGVSVSYVTALGQDRFSDRILEEMAAHGIRADHVERRADKVPGLYAIETDAAGERSFTYWRSDSAARTLFAEPARVGLAALEGFDLIVLSAISLAILPDARRRALIAALGRFRAGGGTVAYDSNHRPRLWEDAETARDVNRAMWRETDIALPSADDEAALFGETDAAAILARLRGWGLRAGALKRGADGPLPIDPAIAPPRCAPVARVVDSTAAGDSFNAGFLAALVGGADPATAMAQGHALAGRVIAHRGAIIPAAAMIG